MEIVEVTNYHRNIFGGAHVVAFLGQRVAVIIDVDSGEELQLTRMRTDPSWVTATANVVAILEQLLSIYDTVAGFQPALASPFMGRVRVEVGHIGAAGLAHHGVLGIAVGPAFLKTMIEGQLEENPVIHHVFGYEFFRNYIDPNTFTTCFDYCCCAGSCKGGHAACVKKPTSWGWVNQGFVNIVGCLLSDELTSHGRPVRFDYFGFSRDDFRGQMEEHIQRYCLAAAAAPGPAGSTVTAPLTWEAMFLHDRLPWNPNSSLDNPYSGILSILYRDHGGRAFLTRMLASIHTLLSNGRAPESKDDVYTAAENFFLAACVGAGADLSGLFVGQLKWPLRAGLTGPQGLACALIAASV